MWGADLPLQLQALPQGYVHFTGCKYRHSKPCYLSAQSQPGDAIYSSHCRRKRALRLDAKGDWDLPPQSPCKGPFLPGKTFSLLLLSRESNGNVNCCFRLILNWYLSASACGCDVQATSGLSMHENLAFLYRNHLGSACQTLGCKDLSQMRMCEYR